MWHLMQGLQDMESGHISWWRKIELNNWYESVKK
jgi:hypothetical protein